MSFTSSASFARWRFLGLAILATLVLAGCDTIMPTPDTFATGEGLQSWLCGASESIRNIFLAIGGFLATLGIGGFGLRTLAPSFFGDWFEPIAGNVKNILVGAGAIGFGPMVIAQAFISLGGAGC